VKLPLKKLAEHVGGYVIGDEDCFVENVATLKNASKGDISFLTNLKYKNELQATQASAVILSEKHAKECVTNALVVANPHPAYAKIATLLYAEKTEKTGIHPTAVVEQGCQIDGSVWIGPCCVIEAGVTIHAGTVVGPGCYIGKNVFIGKDCELTANISVMHDSRLADRVLIHPGVVIGADGFGQAYDNGKWIKVPQVGAVQIGNDVEIGANTAIDRGAIEDTIIDDGVKLDNLIQIAHNVRIGKNTVMAACAAVAGSTTIGENCAIGGQVGIVGHLTIVDNVTITARSAVLQSIKAPGVYSSSAPLEPNKLWHKNYIRFKQLDEMAKRLKALEKELEKLRG